MLCEMLHLRYKTIRTCHQSRRDTISKELDILHTINTKDKSYMPSYLQYRDRGYMYTPHHSFIPFFCDVDNSVKEVVSFKGLDKHRNDLVKIAHTQLAQQQNLKATFNKLLKERLLDDYEFIHGDAEDNVYNELVRKLCNIRIEEMFSSSRQLLASQKGSASTVGQNLRDILLTNHQFTKPHQTQYRKIVLCTYCQNSKFILLCYLNWVHVKDNNYSFSFSHKISS